MIWVDSTQALLTDRNHRRNRKELHMRKPTQHERLLFVFGRYPDQWICATAFLQMYMPTYSQRIG